MPLRLNGSTSGYSQLDAPAIAGDQTFTLPGTGGTIVTTAGTQTLTNKTIQGGAITSGTSVASTSGTSIDFTGIPSWVKRITVMFSGVSLSGSAKPVVQLGSTTFTTSGYLSCSTTVTTSSTASGNQTTGFVFENVGASNVMHAQLILTLVSSNTWIANAMAATSNIAYNQFLAGSIALSGTLDRVRITTTNGTDTFDAGNINILYEG